MKERGGDEVSERSPSAGKYQATACLVLTQELPPLRCVAVKNEYSHLLAVVTPRLHAHPAELVLAPPRKKKVDGKRIGKGSQDVTNISHDTWPWVTKNINSTQTPHVAR